MKKIYMISSGGYSDYRCHGYFLDEESANKYCEYMNKEDRWDEFIVEEFEQIDAEFRPEKTSVEYTYGFYKTDRDGWKIKETPQRKENLYDGDLQNRVCFSSLKETGIIVVYTKEETKAYKIAQDIFYCELAKREGI